MELRGKGKEQSKRRFDKEFKVAAVRLFMDEEMPVCQVAKELGSASEQPLPLGERVPKIR
ncbi:MAG: hypothetical protein SAMD01599839_13140 [Rectinema sp.]